MDLPLLPIVLKQTSEELDVDFRFANLGIYPVFSFDSHTITPSTAAMLTVRGVTISGQTVKVFFRNGLAGMDYKVTIYVTGADDSPYTAQAIVGVRDTI